MCSAVNDLEGNRKKILHFDDNASNKKSQMKSFTERNFEQKKVKKFLTGSHDDDDEGRKKLMCDSKLEIN